MGQSCLVLCLSQFLLVTLEVIINLEKVPNKSDYYYRFSTAKHRGIRRLPTLNVYGTAVSQYIVNRDTTPFFASLLLTMYCTCLA